MKNRFFLPLLVIVCIALSSCSGEPTNKDLRIDFSLSLPDPGSHYYQVQMNCAGIQEEQMVFKLPAWTPGYYKILDLAQHIVNFSAKDSKGQSLSWRKSAKNSWEVATGGSDQIQISYFVFANRRSVAEPFLDTVKGFACPTGIFMHPEHYIDNPVSVAVHPPEFWHSVSTGLRQVKQGEFSFIAEDFDELYDCPILIGNHEIVGFEVQGIPHSIAVENLGDADRDQLISDLRRIVVASTDLIGEIPYDKYEFLIMEQGGGGLEHRNSMAVYSNIADYPGNRSQLGWLGFMAHEYFHLFNVKKIRPFVLGPFDYDREVLTPMLWFSEGGTVYYQERILNNAGITSDEQFLKAMERNLLSHENIPGHLFQSVAQSSWDTWINFFSRSENSRDVTISYYEKGCTISFLLDLAIRHGSSNKKSLDDVMRTLYYDYHKAQDRGFTDEEFRKECEKAASTRLGEIFDKYIPTTDAIDYNKYLAYAGLILEEIPVGEPRELLGKSFQIRILNLKKLANPSKEQIELYENLLRTKL